MDIMEQTQTVRLRNEQWLEIISLLEAVVEMNLYERKTINADCADIRLQLGLPPKKEK